jgi:predicted nucleic acid-binding protein
LLLIDERSGVRIAREQGFTVTGTLGVLVEADRAGIISIEEALRRLARTSFRRTSDLFAQARDLVRRFGKKAATE